MPLIPKPLEIQSGASRYSSCPRGALRTKEQILNYLKVFPSVTIQNDEPFIPPNHVTVALN